MWAAFLGGGAVVGAVALMELEARSFEESGSTTPIGDTKRKDL